MGRYEQDGDGYPELESNNGVPARKPVRLGILTEEGASMAYIFHYQSTERMCDEDDGAIALFEYEMGMNFLTIGSDSPHPFSSLATILAPN